MPESASLESKLSKALQLAKVKSLDDKAAIAMLDQIEKLKSKDKLHEAAAHYSALANVLEKDASLALHAARTYHKATELDAAAKWYLKAAETYAETLQAPKAVASLRIYAQLKPDDTENPKRVYELCLKHGANESSPPSIILSNADRAGSKLLASDFFKTFDSSNYDYLIKNLTYHKFKDGEVINQMGDLATSLYIVISGSVSGYLTLNQQRTYLGDIGENNIFGETAYFTGGKRTAESISRGETEVFELPYTMLDEFKKTLPSFNKRIETLYKKRMLLKQLALTKVFASVKAQSREWIASRMKPVILSAGTNLFLQNELSTDLYLVRAGKIAVTLTVGDTERLVKTVETGGIVGETSLVAKKRRTASVRTITDCVLMKLDGVDFESFYAANEILVGVLEKIKRQHIVETLELMRNIKHVEGDDTCEILLKDAWHN